MRGIAAGVVFGALLGAAAAQPAPDLARAKDLYKSAEDASKEGRFLDAARDYGGAYEITHDPVLFYKIGSANERAGKCDVALIYYGRYLREGRPDEAFAKITREHIIKCGGDPDAKPDPGPVSSPNTGDTTAPPPPVDQGSAVGPGNPPVDTGPIPTQGSASPAPPLPPTTIHPSNKAAWALVASSIALVTVGGVLAYAANSSENDISDLYVGLAGQPPQFNPRTAQTYQDLVDEGHRYQHLSWLSFGLAGGTAIGAAVLFYVHRNDTHEAKVTVTPAATPGGAGVGATIRF